MYTCTVKSNLNHITDHQVGVWECGTWTIFLQSHLHKTHLWAKSKSWNKSETMHKDLTQYSDCIISEQFIMDYGQ